MILITGASSGIGAATARAFAREKKPLALWARRLEKLALLREECLKLGAPSVHVACIDVTNARAIAAEVADNPELYSRTEVLVNNAGLAKGLAPIQGDDPANWEEMIDTNLKGLLHVTHAILPHFLKKGRGHVVNLGSVAGRVTYPRGHVYCATKAAVKTLNEALRIDLSGQGIRVTEIAPGMVETEFSQVRLGDDEKAKAVYAGMTPLSGDDVAETIVWVCSRPAHVNIQEIVIYPTDQASPTVVARKT